MRRLRILHLGKFYPPVRGGMETVLQALCRGANHSVSPRALVTSRSRRTTHEVVDGVPVTRAGSLVTIGAVAVAPSLIRHLAQADADLIVLHEPNPMALVAYFLARSRAPLVIWYHSEVVRPNWRYRLFYRPLLEFALRRALRVVVTSPPMTGVPALAAHRAKCVVIPYGLEVERYGATPAVVARADALRDGARDPILLFVGRLVRYKGLEVLLRAVAGLRARTVIVGDGPLRAALETQVGELGIGDRVQLVGDASDEERLAWLYACAVLVLPSVTRQEAFGMVQLEAMVCGRPVVSTDLPTGVPWVNVHGTSGLVVRPDDVGSLRKALDRLLSDAALRHSLGAAAQARVMDNFTADRMCAAVLGLYHDICKPASYAKPDWWAATAKRTFDVVVSAAGLILSTPLWALIAAAIRLGDGGPVLYRQERSGLHGRRFDVLKFRSMIPDAEAGIGAVQATRADPRVTPVGRVLRATAMDELPQLLNILRGDMSVVGPRALRPGEIETLGNGDLERLEDVPGFVERSQVRPGLTGIAQIYAPRDTPRRLKFKYDLFYIRHRSFWLDVRLVLRSFVITLRAAWEDRQKR
jgi:rhamnosyl/mannosyltransferase